MSGALISIVAGTVLAAAALLVLLQALVIALANVMPPAFAALLVGIVVAAFAYFMVARGQEALKASSLVPERTAANLQRDAQLAREHTR